MITFFTQPVRKILPGSSSLRGKVVSSKTKRMHDFESSLERDLLSLLEFDYNISYYCEQPLTIEYEHEGAIRHYTPDVMIYYREDLSVADKFKPTLCEVKYRVDLKKNWKELKPKFKAASQYAQQNGWLFKILTECEIRTTYLTNVRFLQNFLGPGILVVKEDVDLLLGLMNDNSITTIEELLLRGAADKIKRAELLYTVWHLVAQRWFFCDLFSTLNLQTKIWLP